MAKCADSLTLGIGDLSVNGVDVGYLAGDVVLSYVADMLDVKAGVPERLVKRMLSGEQVTLQASLAQIDSEALMLAAGPASVGLEDDSLELGLFSGAGGCSLDTLTNVQFVHTRDDGSTVTVTLPKAVVTPGLSLNFGTDEWTANDITITSLWDGTDALTRIVFT